MDSPRVAADPVRVVIADDDPDIRSFLAALIGSEPSLALVGAVADAQEAIDVTLATRPDAAVLDWWMPKGGGARAAREISERCHATAIIAFSAYSGAEPSREMRDAGAQAYILKSARSSDEIIDVIRRTGAESRAQSLGSALRSNGASSAAS